MPVCPVYLHARKFTTKYPRLYACPFLYAQHRIVSYIVSLFANLGLSKPRALSRLTSTDCWIEGLSSFPDLTIWICHLFPNILLRSSIVLHIQTPMLKDPLNTTQRNPLQSWLPRKSNIAEWFSSLFALCHWAEKYLLSYGYCSRAISRVAHTVTLCFPVSQDRCLRPPWG